MKKEKKKKFDTVAIFRAIKDKIDKETASMSFEQFEAYLNKKQLEFKTSK